MSDGGAEQSAEEWWSAVVTSARRALRDGQIPPERVLGVGCTSQWLGTVPVSDPVTGLKPGVTYYFRLVARNSAGTSDGAPAYVTTSASTAATT